MHKDEYPTLIQLFSELRGARVTLRPYRLADAQALRDSIVESREHLRPWVEFADQHQTLEETQNWIIQNTASWLLREQINIGIWENTSGRFLGGIGINPRNWSTRYFEVGYWLRNSATGQGYIHEAARLLVGYTFKELAASRVEIRCNANNTPSAAVARRLDFTQEGRLRHARLNQSGDLADTLIFGMLANEWKQIQP